MCRSIKSLRNQEPPVTDADIHAAALQFVRKVSGYRKPSKHNEVAFNSAVADVSHTVEHLLAYLQTNKKPN